ncbi:MAG: hypothetical protein JO208_06105, partial [Alphaproteobacteria bacterium]|nr:hypothetical protein [Alphaproteobacteria bacterium]
MTTRASARQSPVGLAGSVLLHVSIISATLFTFAHKLEIAQESPPVVPVELVTLANKTNIIATVKAPPKLLPKREEPAPPPPQKAEATPQPEKAEPEKMDAAPEPTPREAPPPPPEKVAPEPAPKPPPIPKIEPRPEPKAEAPKKQAT